MMNNDKIITHARGTVLALSGYTQRDAVSILAAAISIITLQPGQAVGRFDEACKAFNSNLLRKRPGNISRIEKDPEVKEFIHNLDRYYTGPELLTMIEDRFGKMRTPSKSSLGRYLQKISRVDTPIKERKE